MIFQSTLSVWRATLSSTTVRPTPSTFQSTLSVWRATLKSGKSFSRTCYFNPRSPCGERRITKVITAATDEISIHALRVESDLTSLSMFSTCVCDFNPRSPCGERQGFTKSPAETYAFQSTLSVWRATYICFVLVQQDKFQSTLSVWRATHIVAILKAAKGLFQSTLSVWRATVTQLICLYNQINFNPRSPCGERL